MKINTSQYFSRLKGYKISKGHFELGSNLHITDYFYAKRLFYNSFYTNRFAFLITRLILKEFSQKIKTKIPKTIVNGPSSLTLLGYENYSDLLVSNVRKMLNDYLRANGALCDIFNHDICTKETLFLRNPERLNNEVILIFPISTTFSTSLKVQSEIIEKFEDSGLQKKMVFLDPIINCLVIPPEPLIESKPFAPGSEVIDYGWENVDIVNRRIWLKHLDSVILNRTRQRKGLPLSKSVIQQQYFIALSTPWHKIDSCKACYPEETAKEICLIETKASSITPNLIFGYPRSFPYKDEKNIFSFFGEKNWSGEVPTVYRRHVKKHGNHYIYYIRTGRFLQQNKDNVTNWLRKNCSPLHRLQDKNVVIVTSTSGSNSGFVNLVNDVLFSDIATIIQYNPKEEFLHNFKLFYTELLQRASAVIYIDDVLATTNSISEINFFVKHTRENGKGIDYSLSLINRTGYYNYLKLCNKFKEPGELDGMERLFNFIDINVPPITHREKYPYMALVEKFKELSDKSVLDTMRLHFKSRELKFRPVDLSIEYDSLKEAGDIRSLHQFLISHEFMKLFKSENDQYYTNWQTIIDIFESHSADSLQKLVEFVEKASSANSLREFIKRYPSYRDETSNALLKICSTDPFIQHGKIKQAAFAWVLSALQECIKEINLKKKVSAEFFQARKNGRLQNYSPYETLLFLLKRGSKLKMNYIYSLEVLEAVSFVINGIREFGFIQYYREVPSDKIDLFDPVQNLVESERKEIYTAQFITFFVALLQELNFDHESKALKLVFNIKKIIDKNIEEGSEKGMVPGRTLKNSYRNDYIHLLRLLVLENTFIFHSTCERFLKRNIQLGFGDKYCASFLHDLNHYFDTYPFLYNRHMLSRFSIKEDGTTHYKPDKDIVRSFQYMMFLKSMFKKDMENPASGSDVLIEQKLQTILKFCCKVLGIKDGGAFFAVNYQNRQAITQDDDIAIVSQYSTSTANIVDSESFTTDSFLHAVFKGIKEHPDEQPLSTFELTFDDLGMFHFRKNIEFDYEDTYHFSEFQEKLFTNIFYLRITEIVPINEGKNYEVRPQAVIGFYSKPLDAIAEEHFIREQEAILEKSKMADQPFTEFQFQSTRDASQKIVFEPVKRTYERFDPKKVRQLLLLRNDLSEFINHHLNNDSLRAYIEMVNNTKFSISLSHGINIYEKLFSRYTRKLDETAATLVEAQQLAINQDTKSLGTIFQYLTNKMHLISLANDPATYEKNFLGDHVEGITLKHLIDEFQIAVPFIFKLEQQNIRPLEDNELFFDSKSIKKKDLEIRLNIFPMLVDELVFEILYNIKKHVVLGSRTRITKENPLEIRMFTVLIDYTLYLCISNNFLLKTPRHIRQLNAKLSMKKGVHGLNLIYNILYKTIGKKPIIDAQDGYFNVNIPLQIIKDNENTNN